MTYSQLFNIWLIRNCLTYVIHDSFIPVKSHIYAWRDAFVGGARYWISYVTRDSFVRDTWLICTWHVTHLYFTRDSFIRDTWLIHTWHTTHFHLAYDLFIRDACLIHVCNTTHPYVTRDSFVMLRRCYRLLDQLCDKWLIHEWLMTNF